MASTSSSSSKRIVLDASTMVLSINGPISAEACVVGTALICSNGTLLHVGHVSPPTIRSLRTNNRSCFSTTTLGPIAAVVEFDKSFQTVVGFSPYLVGVWLGDGTMSTAVFTNEDEECIRALSKELRYYDMRLTTSPTNQIVHRAVNNNRVTGNHLLSYLREAGVLHDKRIPVDILLSDTASRLQCLAGIIDSDGYLYKSHRMFEVVQKRMKLSLDIVFLALSVGLNARVRKVVKAFRLYYRVFLYGTPVCCLSDIPTKISRKQAKPQKTEERRREEQRGEERGRGAPEVALNMMESSSSSSDDKHSLLMFNSY